MIKTFFLSLGSNTGHRLAYLQQAIYKIEHSIGNIESIAPIYKTVAWGFDGKEFLNTCIKVTTALSPNEVLERALLIEKEIGRKRKNATVYLDRCIDIDILFIENQTIKTKNLIVPHPELYNRKFVLAPLNDIGSDFNCPKTKKTISILFKECQDTSATILTTLKLYKFSKLKKSHKIIAIEGNIGVGKTSLAKNIASVFNYKVMLERFDKNPFLTKFYTDKKRHAFATEVSFLADRITQLEIDINTINKDTAIISDYYIFKSLIFAKNTLSPHEYNLYEKLFHLLYNKSKKPDIYIYLQQKPEQLLKNIAKRGRHFEKNISTKYLEKLDNSYLDFLTKNTDLNVKIIDVSSLNFVENDNDFYNIITTILK